MKTSLLSQLSPLIKKKTKTNKQTKKTKIRRKSVITYSDHPCGFSSTSRLIPSISGSLSDFSRVGMRRNWDKKRVGKVLCI